VFPGVRSLDRTSLDNSGKRVYSATHHCPLFQRRWDPIPLELDVGKSLVGYCFLVRISPYVVELGIIGILKQEQRTGLGTLAVNLIKQFASGLGAQRLVTGSGSRGTGPFFRKCGFELAFSEETFYLSLD